MAHDSDSLQPHQTHPLLPFTNNAYDDDDASSTSTSDSLCKPLNSSTADSDSNGFARSAKDNVWWRIMPVRPRRKLQRQVRREKEREKEKEKEDKDVEGDAETVKLYSTKSVRRKRNQQRTWFNYCIFGGISGLTILAFLLITNLVLILASLFWTSDIYLVLQNWGRAGTSSEGLDWYPTDFTRDILPIPCHSHNDYWRRVPLFSALRAGCTGTEADVWLFDNELYVGHNTASLTRNRTFQSLYVNPLVKILEYQNPKTDFYNGTSHGVFDTDPDVSLVLLIDVKTSGPETWPWVLAQLEPLREKGWLTFVQNDTLHKRPITVVGTGNTPFDVLTANSTYRDAFFDAPLETMWEARHATKDSPSSDLLDEDEGLDLPSRPLNDVGQGLSGTTANSSFNELNSYYASVSFNKAVGRVWRSRLTPKQMKIIRGQIRGAHRRGMKVRYWDLPSWPLGLRNHVWDVLVREGVDVLNVDDLRGVGRVVW
ncbi:Altered inheritance of mitochondria protein-like protein [Lachnellula occidentalis]|uniref:Altered inheritance of mitochondria protein 6 n=1 Tax=Lachnellula occidentalis TaxID=215460 RepID=A0A8H8U9W5_9HELO|nr:Altered inheritance of mitochondria protein-like protein [Lachnellula occidentalis]